METGPRHDAVRLMERSWKHSSFPEIKQLHSLADFVRVFLQPLLASSSRLKQSRFRCSLVAILQPKQSTE